MDRPMSLQEVDAWFDLVSATDCDPSFTSAHIDELIPEMFDQAPLGNSLAAFDSLARRVGDAGSSQVALLVISLPPTSQMRRRPPASLTPALLRRSPPALYLCRTSLWCVWGDEEEYRVPVEPPWFTSTQGRVHFRVHRDERARHNGWEFERSFYIHSGPGW